MLAVSTWALRHDAWRRLLGHRRPAGLGLLRLLCSPTAHPRLTQLPALVARAQGGITLVASWHNGRYFRFEVSHLLHVGT
jgi:hypothetical protein